MTTYYECLNSDGKPATASQRALLGKRGYGYASIEIALRYAPINSDIIERHTNGCDDWAGRTVASVDCDGHVTRWID